MAFLCVDIGGTNTLLGLGNGDFQVIKKERSQNFLANVDATLDRILKESNYNRKDIDQVAIAAAGPIDRDKGVFYPPNFFPEIGVEEVELKKPLEGMGEIKIINDCTSAALGEYHYGNHSAENMVYLTISSGIGAGIIVDGCLLEGWNGNLGEVGHIKVGDEVLCGCGGEGHWEAYCSGNNMPTMAQELFDTYFEDAKEIFRAYEEGNQKAAKIIDKMQEFNAVGVANVINTFNPEKIIVGGAVALNHPEKVVKPLEKDAESESINNVPDIEVCCLEEEAVIHGLRAVCNDKF